MGIKGSGGTEGGVGQFVIGLVFAGLAIYLFFDSVYATSHIGIISRAIGRRGHGGIGETTSMGIIFVPFLIAAIALFYDAKMKWAWWLLYGGIAVLAIEALSSIRLQTSMKLTHLLGMMVLFAAGVGLILRSYRDHAHEVADEQADSDEVEDEAKV